MIIENLIKIAKTDKDIKRIKEHKYTQKEQKKLNKINEDVKNNINIDKFMQEVEKIFLKNI